VTAATVQVTVGTSPAGLALTVDGTSYASTQTLSWTVGSSHTIATTFSADERRNPKYLCFLVRRGSDLALGDGAIGSHKLYGHLKHLVSIDNCGQPSVDGTVTPSRALTMRGHCGEPDGNADSGYNFTNWTGSVAGAEVHQPRLP